MEITWFGHSCFRISDRRMTSVVCDPYDNKEVGYVPLKLKADIVTVSHDSPRHKNLKVVYDDPYIITGPGEYEIGGLFITGVSTFRDKKRGADKGQNVIFSVNVNGVVVCHLGELGHTPTQTQVEAMGSVNVLLIPVGIPDGLTPAMASEIVSLVEPDIIVPMNYKTPGLRTSRDTVDRFLKAMGVASGTPLSRLKIMSSSASEETQVILLEPQQA